MFIQSIEDRPEFLGHFHQTDAILRAPSRGAMAFGVGVLTAAIVSCAAAAVLTKAYLPAIFFLPLFVGAIVGLCSPDHPMRGCLLTVLAAILLVVVSLSTRYGIRDALFAALIVSFSLPLVLPEAIIGALCASTIRRYFRGRRADAALRVA